MEIQIIANISNYDHFKRTQELSRHFRPDYKGVKRDKVIPLNESEALVKTSEDPV